MTFASSEPCLPPKQPCSSRTPQSCFFQYFGSPSLTACPVSDRHSIFLDFSLGYNEASHSRWIDAYEGLGMKRSLSSKISPNVHIEESSMELEEEGEDLGTQTWTRQEEDGGNRRTRQKQGGQDTAYLPVL